MPLDSYTITQGRDRAPARAMLKGIGFTDADLAKPIIGVANTWIETMPCNYNLRELAVKVKEGIRAAGGTPMEFNTIAISDGVTSRSPIFRPCGSGVAYLNVFLADEAPCGGTVAAEDGQRPVMAAGESDGISHGYRPHPAR